MATGMTRSAIVVGGGPAGLSCACLLAHDGVATTLIAPDPVVDHRTTALMDPSIRMLRYLGVWGGSLAESSAPLNQLHILDDTGNSITAPKLEFSAKELDLDAFGYNVPLAQLVPALHKRATELGVAVVKSAVIQLDFDAGSGSVTVFTADGLSRVAQVVIAADGAQSLVRQAAGIDVVTTEFNQSALVTSFSHSVSHQFISTEFHKAAGPFTTVPLPGRRSSLVWMGRPSQIESLLAMSDDDLAAEIQIETHGSLGKIGEIGRRASYKMRSQTATKFASRRVMLVGEAAHQLPPIGAQGLNMSLRDAAHAADLIVNADDPGADRVMIEYDNLRRSDVSLRSNAVRWMNASLLSDFPPAAFARIAALAVAGSVPQLRNFVMRQGLAPSSNLPFAMRAG